MSSIDLPSYCVLCFESAERMIVILRDYFGPKGILRYAIVCLLFARCIDLYG